MVSLNGGLDVGLSACLGGGLVGGLHDGNNQRN